MAGSLAVIVTAYGERGADNLPRLREAIRASTREPDETWVLVERIPQGRRLLGKWAGKTRHRIIDTPRHEDGTYALVPYSLKQNYALDRTECDYIAYATDDSWPSPEKYAAMAAYLDSYPEVGAVYCTQDYGGVTRVADLLMSDAHCKVDHTQVMHRRTADRWPEEIEHLTLGDAVFWRRLHESLGPFYPLGPDVMDYVQQTPDGISAGQRA